MRIFSAALALVLICVPADAADPLLPPKVDLVQKREQLFGAYPEFPAENAMTALRRYGNAISRYEQEVIAGWQQEILERCRQVKEFERFISKRNARGELSPNEYAEHIEAIADERELCDAKNKDTSPLWQLEAELRTMNSKRFTELEVASTLCSRTDDCRTR